MQKTTVPITDEYTQVVEMKFGQTSDRPTRVAGVRLKNAGAQSLADAKVQIAMVEDGEYEDFLSGTDFTLDPMPVSLLWLSADPRTLAADAIAVMLFRVYNVAKFRVVAKCAEGQSTSLDVEYSAAAEGGR